MGTDNPEFEAFYRKHYQTFFLFFRKKTFSDEDANELTQDTFLRVYKKWDSVSDSDKRLAWAFQVAKNVWRNCVRNDIGTLKRKGEEVPYDETTPHDTKTTSGPEKTLLDKESLEMVNMAIEELPKRQKECIKLVAERKKYCEIATLLHLNIQTVKSHISHARKALKQKTGDLFHFKNDD